MDDLRALTVRQPWAWAIVAGHKDIENRPVRISRRGPLLIHAGTQIDPAGELALRGRGAGPARIVTGAIIGMVHVVACVDDSSSTWAQPGRWHWVLADPVTFDDPIPARGQMGLWRPSLDALEQVEHQRAQYAS